MPFDVLPSNTTSAIAVQDEGVQLTAAANTFNFVGAGVEASEAGAVVTVTIPGASGLPSRQTVTVNIASLTNDATAEINIPLAKGFTIYRVDTSIPYRVRIYSTAAYRTADAARQPGTAPTGDHGVILDTLTTSTKLYDSSAPYATGVNLEATPTADIPAAITNKSGSTQSGTVTIIYLPEES